MPVSSRRRSYVGTLCRLSAVSAGVPRTCETSPAACHVVPPVSRARSSTDDVGPAEPSPGGTRSRTPMMPPPTITTRAPAGGSSTGDRIDVVELPVRQVLVDRHRPRSLPRRRRLRRDGADRHRRRVQPHAREVDRAAASRDRSTCGVEGAVGDRRFVFARDDGTRLHGISKAPLMPIVSTWDRDRERLRLRFPDGTEVEGDARPAGPPHGPSSCTTARSRARSDRPASSPRPCTADRPHAGPAPACRRARVRGRRRTAPRSCRSPRSRTSGRRGGERGPRSTRRFRMLIELDGLAPYEEDAWQGGRVRIGEAVLRLGDRMPRCVMTTLHPDTGVQDVDTLGMHGRHRRHEQHVVLGVYGDVLEPGAIGSATRSTVLARAKPRSRRRRGPRPRARRSGRTSRPR